MDRKVGDGSWANPEYVVLLCFPTLGGSKIQQTIRVPIIVYLGMSFPNRIPTV